MCTEPDTRWRTLVFRRSFPRGARSHSACRATYMQGMQSQGERCHPRALARHSPSPLPGKLPSLFRAVNFCGGYVWSGPECDACLVSSSGRWRSSRVLRRRAGLLLEHSVGVRGRQLVCAINHMPPQISDAGRGSLGGSTGGRDGAFAAGAVRKEGIDRGCVWIPALPRGDVTPGNDRKVVCVSR